jgi:hypothetical protein
MLMVIAVSPAFVVVTVLLRETLAGGNDLRRVGLRRANGHYNNRSSKSRPGKHGDVSSFQSFLNRGKSRTSAKLLRGVAKNLTRKPV